MEGIWDIDEKAKENYTGILDKNLLIFKLMIRQPAFVNDDFAFEIIEKTKKKKPHELLEKVKFEATTEGLCVQMLHNGSYDNEPESFRQMEVFTTTQNLKRACMTHREIYLSDARKVAADKLKTVLRFKVE